VRPTGCQPILLYDQAVDMRKSFEGLSALVEAAFPGKLLTGSLLENQAIKDVLSKKW